MAQAAPTKGALTAAKHSHALAETGYEIGRASCRERV